MTRSHNIPVNQDPRDGQTMQPAVEGAFGAAERSMYVIVSQQPMLV